MPWEEFKLEREGNTLRGSILFPEGTTSPLTALCICHGIPSGQPADPGDEGYPGLAHYFSELGLAVVIFNFRGTGPSEGNFDILGWTRDLRGVIDYLYGRRGIRRDKFFLMGFSGGGAVAIYCAAHDERVSHLISCATPAEFQFVKDKERIALFIEHCRRIGIIRDQDFPSALEEWIQGFDLIAPRRWIREISPRPLLILHGAQDELIEKRQAEILFEEAREPKELFIIEGCGHKLRLFPQAMELARNWIDKYL